MPVLTPGPYHISLAITDGSLEDFKVCDYIENALSVEVATRETAAPGYLELRCAKVAIS
jgi:hypothetical protein